MRRHGGWTLCVLAVAVLFAAAALGGPTEQASSQQLAPGPSTPEAQLPQLAPAGAALAVPTPVAPVIQSPVEPSTTLIGPADPRVPTLAGEIDALLRERTGAYGVTVEWVPTQQRASHDAEREFASASVYKVAVAYRVLQDVDQGQLGLADQITITDDDAVEVEPDGGLGPGDEVSVRDALQAMIAVSSNSAAHALMRVVGRPEINASLAGLGLYATRVPEDDDPDGSAVTTASDMASLFDLLADDRLLTPESRQTLRDLLATPKDLDPLLACLPDGTEVLSKPGNQERASNIAGLVSTPNGPLVISVFDADVDPGDARATIEAITQAAWAVFAE